MRPDEHKKKRSAQYKKKHGMAKETSEKQDGKPHKDRPRSSAHCNQKFKESAQHEKTKDSGASNSQKLTSSSSSDSEEEGRQHKTYSKRKIVSNWDRYDIPTTEEDKVEQRGEDFTKLLHSAGDAVSQFRFQDEQDWEEEDVNVSVGSEFLAVDVNNLATSLSCLPLYERLGLHKNLFSEEQLVELDKVAEQNKEFYKPSECQSSSSDTRFLSPITSADDGIGISEDTSNTDSKQIISNHSNRTDLSEILKTKLSVCNSKTTSKTVVDSCNSETKNTDSKTILTSSENLKSNVVKSDCNVIVDTDKSNIDQSKVDNIDSVEDELDFLLSLDKPADINDKGDNSHTAKSQSKGNENKDNVVALETRTKQDKPPTKDIKSETDDLEDWLDSVLDD